MQSNTTPEMYNYDLPLANLDRDAFKAAIGSLLKKKGYSADQHEELEVSYSSSVDSGLKMTDFPTFSSPRQIILDFAVAISAR